MRLKSVDVGLLATTAGHEDIMHAVDAEERRAVMVALTRCTGDERTQRDRALLVAIGWRLASLCCGKLAISVGARQGEVGCPLEMFRVTLFSV